LVLIRAMEHSALRIKAEPEAGGGTLLGAVPRVFFQTPGQRLQYLRRHNPRSNATFSVAFEK
jgi:hypothetical protein